MQRYIILVCHMCLLRVFVFNWHNANICHTVCHTPRTELAACLDNRTLGGLNTLNTREPSCVSCPSNVCNVYNSDSHLVSMGLHTHIRIAWATMGLATVRRPLVTPFWGLSIVEVINTYLHFVFLSFLLDPFPHLRVLKRRQPWDKRFRTYWFPCICIWDDVYDCSIFGSELARYDIFWEENFDGFEWVESGQ